MLSRMNKVLQIDLRNRMAVVEAGVPNFRLTQALAGTGYHFAPDPSSQGASTIGGNVATNAGGPHTLKYGVTVNHVLGVEAVLADGSIVQLGPVDGTAGLDLIGVLVGSEGTLAIVTKVWVRLTPNPQHHRAMRAIFNSVDDAGNAVSQIIAAGIIPAAMELMDQGILAAVEEAFQFGFPPDAGAVLVIEVDGPTPDSIGSRSRSWSSASDSAQGKCCRPPRPRSASCCGNAASRPWERPAGLARATRFKTAWCRAPGCRTSFAARPKSAKNTRFAL